MEVAKKTDDEELKKYFKEALDVIQKLKQILFNLKL